MHRLTRVGVWLVWMVMALPAGAYNEQVTAIAYNPSPSGNFSYLKVSEEAQFASGIRIPKGGTLNFVGPVEIAHKKGESLDTDYYCKDGKCDVKNMDQIGLMTTDKGQHATVRTFFKEAEAQSSVLQGSEGRLYSYAELVALTDIPGNVGAKIEANGGTLTIQNAVKGFRAEDSDFFPQNVLLKINRAKAQILLLHGFVDSPRSCRSYVIKEYQGKNIFACSTGT